MEDYKFSYDEKTDDLFLYNSEQSSKGSVELGDLIIDFNAQKQLVGIQIIGASKFLKDLVNEKESMLKKLLAELENCKVDIKPKNNLLIVQISLSSKTAEVRPVLSVPVIEESSPAIACL